MGDILNELTTCPSEHTWSGREEVNPNPKISGVLLENFPSAVSFSTVSLVVSSQCQINKLSKADQNLEEPK